MNIDNNGIENVETGKWVVVITKYGGAILGQVLSQGERLTEKMGIEKIYRIGIIGEQVIDLYENEIYALREYNLVDIAEYLEQLEQQYGIKCFDEKDEYIGNSSLIGKVVYDGAWERFSDNEKIKFVKNLNFQYEEIVEMLDTLCNSKKALAKAHNQRMKELDSRKSFLNQWVEVTKKRNATEREYNTLIKGLIDSK